MNKLQTKPNASIARKEEIIQHLTSIRETLARKSCNQNCAEVISRLTK